MISQDSLNTLFLEARTYNAWQDKPVSLDLLHQIFDLAKMAPTSANCSPMRVVFVQSQEAKEKLKPCLAAGNVDKTMAAPVTALVAYDLKFYDYLPRLFPHADARSWFVGNDPFIQSTAEFNGALQAAYLIMAARACGLDCGPMTGFDKQAVDDAFFAGTSFKSSMLCNLGYGDVSGLYPRSPRFDFDDVCQVL
ncbi:MAG: malonic semialdehyde reductase [Candidatus Paracaedibacteraceae bacterium]|nr:malonic semialdehyde reductase [Candidatus Paracaedibacteraceae bacterium]